jgi:hypothetical protein
LVALKFNGGSGVIHIFVRVVRSRQDAFAGIRRALETGSGRWLDVSLDEDELDIVDSVEYTWRRPYRFWFYRNVFPSLERRLDEAITANPGPICLYFTDEGVWAVLFDRYRRRLARRDVRAVNVQHGFALCKVERGRVKRRLINSLTVVLTGYPNFGYGSLGGAGPAPFDLYLTYDEATAAFARRQSGREALAAPHLIKHELWERFSAMPHPDGPPRVLFAMNIAIPSSPVLCNSQETWDLLVPVAEVLAEAGARLTIRLHPGMDRAIETARFAAHPLARLATLDTHRDLHKSMAEAAIVMSYVSTALWEARLLGLIAVQVVCRCCRPVELGYPRQVLKLDTDLQQQILPLIARLRTKKTVDWAANEAKEWALATELLDGPHV